MENLMHEPSEEQNLRTERLIFIKCLIYRRWRLISDQWTLSSNFSSSSNQWTYRLDSGWSSHSLNSLLINTAHPKPSANSLIACFSMRFWNYNSPVIPKLTQFLITSICLSLSPFFGLTKVIDINNI